MKKITSLFIILFTSILCAQTTFDITWDQSVGSAASITIQQGDAIRWTWGNSVPHSVTSLAGSQETFDSGILTGQGTTFLYTFTQVGTNPYQCDVHPASMNGVVTVNEVLSVEDKFIKNISFYPNPVKKDLTLFSLYKLDNYKIFNVLGSLVAEGTGGASFTQIDMSNLNSGMYFVKVFSKNMQATFKIAKK